MVWQPGLGRLSWVLVWQAWLGKDGGSGLGKFRYVMVRQVGLVAARSVGAGSVWARLVAAGKACRVVLGRYKDRAARQAGWVKSRWVVLSRGQAGPVWQVQSGCVPVGPVWLVVVGLGKRGRVLSSYSMVWQVWSGRYDALCHGAAGLVGVWPGQVRRVGSWRR
jgi:hypothetical protein